MGTTHSNAAASIDATSLTATLSTTASSPIPEAFEAASWTPATTSSYGGDDMVTLLVGPKEQHLFAHGSYLVLQSKFFKAALGKEWVEGQTRTVKLPEEELNILAQYLDFIYRNVLPTDSITDDSRGGEVFNVLIGLFALGERLLDSTIRNAIIKEIVRFTTIGKCKHPGLVAINNIYNCTTATSPARRLMVDLYTYRGEARWLNDEMHPMFLLELGQALLLDAQRDLSSLRTRRAVAESYVI